MLRHVGYRIDEELRDYSQIATSHLLILNSSPESAIGNAENRTWVWLEGLVHYEEVHQVGLPDEFLETME